MRRVRRPAWYAAAVSAGLLAGFVAHAHAQATGDYGRTSEGTKSQSHHVGQPHEHPMGEAHPSGRTTNQSPFQLQAQEDRVAWTEWCEEFKRLLKSVVWEPLSAEFSGRGKPWYQATASFRFQNPRLYAPPYASVGKPGAQVQKREELAYFQSRVHERLRELVAQVPEFPPKSNIAYFTRNSTFTFNYGGTKEEYADCENFLDEIERRPPAPARQPARKKR